MGELHEFHRLIAITDKTPTEKALVAAVMLLSVDEYRHLTPEQIFDQLIHLYSDSFVTTGVELGQPYLHMLYRRILSMERSILKHINRTEIIQLTTSTAITRLQADNDKLKTMLSDLQTSQTAAAQAAADAYTRFQASLTALQNAAGDEDAVNAVAQDMETNVLPALQALKDAATANAGIAAGEDVAAAPPATGGTGTPPTTAAIVITPSSATVAAGNTVQFSANVSVKWSANAGSIDDSGVYTPPPDATVTSDVVTATAADGTTSTASVTIGQ